MNIQKTLFEILNFGKNFLLSFILSVARPYTFYFTRRYDRYKVQPQAYLYVSIFIYLLYFASKRDLFTDPKEAVSAVKTYTNLTVFDALIYTVPIFLYSVLLIWIVLRLIKSTPWVSDYGFSYTLFSNALNIEALCGFMLAILIYFIRIEFRSIDNELNVISC